MATKTMRKCFNYIACEKGFFIAVVADSRLMKEMARNFFEFVREKDIE